MLHYANLLPPECPSPKSPTALVFTSMLDNRFLLQPPAKGESINEKRVHQNDESVAKIPSRSEDQLERSGNVVFNWANTRR
jgi:hypothetical protein